MLREVSPPGFQGYSSKSAPADVFKKRYPSPLMKRNNQVRNIHIQTYVQKRSDDCDPEAVNPIVR